MNEQLECPYVTSSGEVCGRNAFLNTSPSYNWVECHRDHLQTDVFDSASDALDDWVRLTRIFDKSKSLERENKKLRQASTNLGLIEEPTMTKEPREQISEMCKTVWEILMKYETLSDTPSGYFKSTMLTLQRVSTGVYDEVVDILVNRSGELERMLLQKNADYGNSALDPVRRFSGASPAEQIRVRMDDKLSRILRGAKDKNYDEDTIMDLAGYLILLMIAL